MNFVVNYCVELIYIVKMENVEALLFSICNQ